MTIQEEVANLTTLIDVVATRLEKEIRTGSTKTLRKLLWNVPTNILAKYAKDE